MNILIVDDSITNLMMLEAIAKKIDGVTIEAMTDPQAALAAAVAEAFDVVVVDYMMPMMNGIAFVTELRALEHYKHVPIVMVTGEADRQVRLDAIAAGATDFLNKPVDPIELRARLNNLLALRRAQLDLADRAHWLAREVAKATRHLIEQEEEVIWRLSRALEFRDGGTGEHISRVAGVAQLIAEQMGFDADFCRTLYLAAPLHDVGKVAIPDAILGKPGRLTDEEMAVMRTHVEAGERILSGSRSELIHVAEKIVRSHHERWDGTGYPRRLAGEAIPIEGRIVAVADVFDALTTSRPYKKAWSLEAARQAIEEAAGTHFDPVVVRAFSACWAMIVPIYREAGEAAA